MKSSGRPSPYDGSNSKASQASSSADDALVREASTYMTDPEAETLCQTFAEGLRSGIGYARILDILIRQDFSRKTVGRLREALLERGDLLGEALARYGILDPNARKLILVAEQQAALPETFGQLAKNYLTRYRRKKSVCYGLVEPMILVALGLIFFGNLLRDGKLIELAFSEHTWVDLIDLAITSGIQSVAFWGVCFVLCFGWLKLPVDLGARDAVGRLWKRTPFFGKPSRLLSISLFCRYLKQSIASGMTVYQGLELGAEAANHPGILKGYRKAQKRIDEGATLAESLRVIGTLPIGLLEKIDIAEEAGRLDERLAALGSRYKDKAEESFDRVMTICITILRYAIILFVLIMALTMVLGFLGKLSL